MSRLREEVARDLAALRAHTDREFGRILAKLNTAPTPRPRVADDDNPAAADRDEAGLFHGLPITARFAGRCTICGQDFPAGEQVLLGTKSRKCAHVGCGAV
jgi:hypothetical protein